MFKLKPVKTVDSIISSISQNIIDLEAAETAAEARKQALHEETVKLNIQYGEAMKEQDRAARIKSRLIDLIS